MSRAVIDPLPCWPLETRLEHTELHHPDRCRHDMLPGQCSWCRGLPDVPISDPWTEPETPVPAVRWQHAEHPTECRACGGDIGRNEPVAYSPHHNGPIGRCCGEAA